MTQQSKNLIASIFAVAGLFTMVSLAGNGGSGALFVGLLGMLIGLAYCIPSFVAFEHQHSNATAILALNVILGWLLIPWVAALVWALSKNRAAEAIENRSDAATSLRMSNVDEGFRNCPFCAETIKAEAKLCKHCHSDLSHVGSLGAAKE